MARSQLFSDLELRMYLERLRQALVTEIDQLQPDTITGTDIDELTRYLVEKYAVSTPVLDEQNITVEQVESKIDVSQDPQRLILDRSRPFHITATRVTHYVPFCGDSSLFMLRPSYYSSRFPTATIDGNELAFVHDDTRHDAAGVQTAFADAIGETKKLLTWIDNDVRPFNDSLPAAARERLTARREKLMKDQHLVQALGYPLRRRTNAPTTYTVSTVRKKLALPPRTPTSSAEPTIDDAAYEHIIGIIHSMALVLERSPNAFRGMSEEDLRTHFLVQLNGHYEGQATGETFNAIGKTDILIRHENRNLFIAECKFWNGASSLTGAIDQLLSYTSWRDTKTAILLFSRNKNFSDVLGQVADTVKAHANTIRQEHYASETGYRFTLHHQNDKERRLTLTILAFNIPT
jgi:hypothetical protein